MRRTPHPHPSPAQHSQLDVCRMRGLYCACSQAPRQQGHLVPKQMLPSLELLALRVCVCKCECVCVCACVLAWRGGAGIWVKNASSGRGQRARLWGHLSHISAFHIKTFSVQRVGEGLKGHRRYRNTLSCVTGQTALVNVWTVYTVLNSLYGL